MTHKSWISCARVPEVWVPYSVWLNKKIIHEAQFQSPASYSKEVAKQHSLNHLL